MFCSGSRSGSGLCLSRFAITNHSPIDNVFIFRIRNSHSLPFDWLIHSTEQKRPKRCSGFFSCLSQNSQPPLEVELCFWERRRRTFCSVSHTCGPLHTSLLTCLALVCHNSCQSVVQCRRKEEGGRRRAVAKRVHKHKRRPPDSKITFFLVYGVWAITTKTIKSSFLDGY